MDSDGVNSCQERMGLVFQVQGNPLLEHLDACCVGHHLIDHHIGIFISRQAVDVEGVARIEVGSQVNVLTCLDGECAIDADRRVVIDYQRVGLVCV